MAARRRLISSSILPVFVCLVASEALLLTAAHSASVPLTCESVRFQRIDWRHTRQRGASVDEFSVSHAQLRVDSSAVALRDQRRIKGQTGETLFLLPSRLSPRLSCPSFLRYRSKPSFLAGDAAGDTPAGAGAYGSLLHATASIPRRFLGSSGGSSPLASVPVLAALVAAAACLALIAGIILWSLCAPRKPACAEKRKAQKLALLPVLQATSDFNASLKVGAGDFGEAYACVGPKGEDWLVVRGTSSAENGRAFRREVCARGGRGKIKRGGASERHAPSGDRAAPRIVRRLVRAAAGLRHAPRRHARGPPIPSPPPTSASPIPHFRISHPPLPHLPSPTSASPIPHFRISHPPPPHLPFPQVDRLSDVSHPAIAQLLGWCDDRRERLLIYAMRQGVTLAERLRLQREERGGEDDGGGRAMTFLERLDVAIAVAEALAYMHRDCQPQLLHREVCSSNVLLLPGSPAAMLTSVGLIKGLPSAPTAKRVRNSAGYLDPDYFHSLRATAATDVYSFGVVLLELLTGQLAESHDSKKASRKSYINIQWAVRHINASDVSAVVDPRMDHGVPEAAIKRFAGVAVLCVARHTRKRPDSASVLRFLNEIRTDVAPSLLSSALSISRSPSSAPSSTISALSAASGATPISASIGAVPGKPVSIVDIGEDEYAEDSRLEVAPLYESQFSYYDLVEATKGFSRKRWMRRSYLGEVYQGTLGAGSDVMVVRQSGSGGEAWVNQTVAGAKALAKVHHPDLTTMLGCSIGPDYCVLVFNYIPFPSLSHLLHTDDEAVPVLPWEVRVRVVEGVAEGLLHLHSFCHPPIVHGRVSSRAVLMDRHVSPKLSDFGMPHFTPHAPSCVAAAAAGAAAGAASGAGAAAGGGAAGGGRNGSGSTEERCAEDIYLDAYAAPELLPSTSPKSRSPFANSSPTAAATASPATASKGRGSMEAADVFAFGVVVFEIISGQHPHDPRRMPASLVEWARQKLWVGRDNLVALVDPRLAEEFDPHEVEGLAELALRCTQTNPSKRPSMEQVVETLGSLMP
ncbi:unnamed protein product [Closterium sp. Yama58-4]|nr:unnamed protein product [Closterium sp. Yama58-4]